MRRSASAVLALFLVTTAATAAQAPPLPDSAKKLSAPQIMKLYDGNTFAFTSYTAFGTATGTVTYDFKTKTNHGHYQLGSHQGSINGQIHMDGDKFCYKVGLDREHCDFVYLVGGSVYDVDTDGTVESVALRH